MRHWNKGTYLAHKSECRHNHDLPSNGSTQGNIKLGQLYYKPKITDGYLIKWTNWINWDTLDKEVYSNQPFHGKKIYWDFSPLNPSTSINADTGLIQPSNTVDYNWDVTPAGIFPDVWGNGKRLRYVDPVESWELQM
jgi:hypothetical protein